MSISFFEEIFEFTQFRQVYKGKVGRGNFQKTAIRRSVHQFYSTFFKKLHNHKVGKVKKICTMVAIKKNAQLRTA